ncbi:hypothetical protein FIU85_03220 [Roseovarius sp. THAF8]|nr:hypothetical protein FIU85_03220 [Roseovarius sp. THAF8]
MRIAFAKFTDFGWHIMLDQNQRPFSLRLSAKDVNAEMRKEVDASDFADVEAALETSKDFVNDYRSMCSGLPHPKFPSMKEWDNAD